MGAVKDTALMLAGQGDLQAYAALKALPEQERGVLTAIASSNKELAVEILALLAGSGTGKDGRKPMPFRGAVYAAARQLRTGERLGREFYWNEYTGPMDSLIGIRDLTTRNIGPSSWEGPFPLTEDEAKAHGLELTGDHSDMAGKVFITVDADRRSAVETYTRELAAYKATLEALKARADLLEEKVDPAVVPAMPELKYRPVIGIGIIWGEEVYANVYKNPDDKRAGKNPKDKWGARVELDLKNFSWMDRLLYRCLRSGYKMIPGALRGAEPSSDDVDFDLGGKAVGRDQWLAAQEKEKARAQQVVVLDGAQDKDQKMATMRAGAYGVEQPASVGTPQAEAPAIDVDAVIAGLRADAEERTAKHPGAATQKQLDAAWVGLNALGLPDGGPATLLTVIFDHAGDLTAAECATVWFWLKPAQGPTGVTLDAEAQAQAKAIWMAAGYDAAEVPFAETPEVDDASTLDD